MKRCPARISATFLICAAACAQEADYGFEVPATVSVFSAQSHRGSPARSSAYAAPAFRAVIYPSVKLGKHWFGYGAVQVHSSPYFYEELATTGHAIRAHILQAYVGYARVADGRSLVLKAGQLTSAFGSFALRYDDQRNWLIDLPQSYGYYYYPVTLYGLPGAEADINIRNVDLRLQYTNSHPSNPRKLWQSGQFGAWTAGGGVRLLPSLRIGASATHGAYLHQGHRYFFPGEAPPRTLPATGFGVDVQWARGRWNVNAEAHRFQYPYRAIPYFFNTLGYTEVKFTVNPRLYVAGRAGTRLRSAGLGHDEAYEFVVGIRTTKGHLLKIGYLALDGPFSPGTRDNVLGLQYSVQIRPPAVTWGE